MAKELLTVPELLVVAHRQGFGHLREIERCILEPAGSFYIEGKTPPVTELRHVEILTRLDQLSRQIEELKTLQGEAGRP